MSNFSHLRAALDLALLDLEQRPSSLWLAERAGRPSRQVAAEVSGLIGVDVSHTTVARWMKETETHDPKEAA